MSTYSGDARYTGWVEHKRGFGLLWLAFTSRQHLRNRAHTSPRQHESRSSYTPTPVHDKHGPKNLFRLNHNIKRRGPKRRGLSGLTKGDLRRRIALC